MQRSSEFDFVSALEHYGLKIAPVSVETMQVNITRQCNQACTHCHVDASPDRTEKMTLSVMERCLEVLAERKEIATLDITGGAPELHPDFRFFVMEARKLGKKVTVRHNLTVMFCGGAGDDLADFFASNEVEVVASFPHHSEFFTNRQRGPGVFKKSISALKLLNERRYGEEGSGLVLNLVYNPNGGFIPAAQSSLEKDFKEELFSRYGIVFNRLSAITNMPVNRFKTQLERSGTYGDYMKRLRDAFNPKAAENVMCRRQISVGYDGSAYDCDFNQMLGLKVITRQPVTVFNLDCQDFLNRRIVFGSHCFGCTAGAGST